MKSKILCMSLLLQAIVCTAFAQSLQVTGTLKGNVPADLRLYIMPAERIWDKPDSVSVVNGSIRLRPLFLLFRCIRSLELRSSAKSSSR